jgi:hypothetical protein
MPIFFWCLRIDSKHRLSLGDQVFRVDVPAGTILNDLKERVKVMNQDLALISGRHLLVWKWMNGLNTYKESVLVGKPTVSDFIENGVQLQPWDMLNEAPNDLFVVVSPQTPGTQFPPAGGMALLLASLLAQHV